MLHPDLLNPGDTTKCRIVTAPDEAATVLVDLNDKRAVALDRGRALTLGAPRLLPSTGTSIDAEPRVVKLPLKIYGDQGRAEAAIVAIARELLSTQARYILWQQNRTATPMWLKVRPRSTSGELDLSMVPLPGDAQAWRWDLEVEAEPFAYGARVTETLNLEYRLWSGGQDRDTLSAKLAEVKGDAPSRLRVEVRPSGSMAGWSPWVNVTAVPEDSWSGPTVWQAEAFNPGSGYARQEITFGGPDPTAGNPYNVLRTFSSQSYGYAGAVAITGPAPSVPPPGRYTMLIRLITGDTVATAPSFRWGIQAGGAGMYGMWRTWDKPAKSGQYASWLALDSFQLPAGVNPAGLSAQEGMAPTLALWHKGDGASATVYVDKILLVPAELADGVTHNLNALAVNDWYGAASNSALLIDDEVLRVAIIDRLNPPRFFSAPPPKLNGGFPSVTPGLDNWLTLIPNVGTGGGDDASGPETFEVVVSYHPRYLHLAAS